MRRSRTPPLLPRSLPLRLLAVWLLLAGGAAAQTETPAPSATRVAVAAEDATTLRFADGTRLRLAGLLAPPAPLGYRGVWRSAERARQGLAVLALDLPLAVTPTGQDRWGRAVGHVRLPDGRDLGDLLLAAGWALVAGLEPTPRRAARLRLEAEARAGERGLWADAYYRVREADALPAELPELDPARFVIVEGRVADAAVVRGRAYLNFGADWRSDFTATLSPDARRRFRAAGLDPRDYAGRRLRVRGWLESFNGPMIEIVSPDQIEVLEEP